MNSKSLSSRRKMITKTGLLYNGIFLLILFFFFSSIERIEDFLLIGMIVFLLAAYGSSEKLIIPKVVSGTLIIMILCWGISLFGAKYNQIYSVLRFAFLILLFLIIANDRDDLLKDQRIGSWFYYVLLLLVVYNIYRNYSRDVTFDSIGDRNYTGVLIFSLFLYSNKTKHLCGVTIPLVYALFFTQGRTYRVVIALFYLIILLQRLIGVIKKRFKKSEFRISFRALFLIGLIGTAIFSFFWVFHVSAGGVGEYHSGINDTSNRLRFVANINGFDMLQDPKNTLLWGYGNYLKEHLGIDTQSGAMTTYYLGVRLEQPHNSILNVVLRAGMIPGFLYFNLLAALLEKINRKDNGPYLYPYMLNGMIMHSLFEGVWLIFWLVILLMPRREGKWRII